MKDHSMKGEAMTKDEFIQAIVKQHKSYVAHLYGPDGAEFILASPCSIELEFLHPPEEFAAELWEKVEAQQADMVALLTKIGELRYAYYNPIGDQLGGLGDWLDIILARQGVKT